MQLRIIIERPLKSSSRDAYEYNLIIQTVEGRNIDIEYCILAVITRSENLGMTPLPGTFYT